MTTKNRIRIFTATTILACLLCSPADATLITNPGNDDDLVGGEIPGWTEVVGTNWTQRSANPTPQSGAAYFFAGVGATAELAQTVDVSTYSGAIDAGIQFFDFSGYVSGWRDHNDTAQIILEFESSLGVVLGSWDSGAIYNPYDEAPEWLLLTHSQYAPANTRQVQIRLISERGGGLNNDGYFDTLQLNTYALPMPVPEPSTLMVATIGLFGMISLGWRLRRLSPGPVVN